MLRSRRSLLPPGPSRSAALARRARRVALAGVVAVALAACVAPTPQLDQRFGATVRLAIAQQTLDPGAAGRAAPVPGIDGPSAMHAIEQYQKSFAAPAPAPGAFTIGVSGAQ